jgi:hypothetical protein
MAMSIINKDYSEILLWTTVVIFPYLLISQLWSLSSGWNGNKYKERKWKFETFVLWFNKGTVYRYCIIKCFIKLIKMHALCQEASENWP